jgi:hypothetical protein
VATADEQSRGINTFALIADDLITRPVDAAADQAFFTTDQKLLSAKLAEYGQKFPDNLDLPQGGLFLLVVTDHVQEAFKGLSMIDAQHEVVVDLAADKDAKPPGAAEKGKKRSRLLIVATAPIEGIKRLAVKTADGIRREAKSEELKG